MEAYAASNRQLGLAKPERSNRQMAWSQRAGAETDQNLDTKKSSRLFWVPRCKEDSENLFGRKCTNSRFLPWLLSKFIFTNLRLSLFSIWSTVECESKSIILGLVAILCGFLTTWLILSSATVFISVVVFLQTPNLPSRLALLCTSMAFYLTLYWPRPLLNGWLSRDIVLGFSSSWKSDEYMSQNFRHHHSVVEIGIIYGILRVCKSRLVSAVSDKCWGRW